MTAPLEQGQQIKSASTFTAAVKSSQSPSSPSSLRQTPRQARWLKCCTSRASRSWFPAAPVSRWRTCWWRGPRCKRQVSILPTATATAWWVLETAAARRGQRHRCPTATYDRLEDKQTKRVQMDHMSHCSSLTFSFDNLSLNTQSPQQCYVQACSLHHRRKHLIIQSHSWSDIFWRFLRMLEKHITSHNFSVIKWFSLWFCDLILSLSLPTRGHHITAIVPGGDSYSDSTKLRTANTVLFL